MRSDIVDAPYVKEFPIVLECKFIQSTDLGMHIQLNGEILDVKVDEDVINESGVPDINKIKPFMFDPGSLSYYGVGNELGKAFNIGMKFK